MTDVIQASRRGVGQLSNWITRSFQTIPVYRNWPVAIADRVLLRGQERTYSLSDRCGGATLAARTWADTRIINELWIDDPYLRHLPDEASVDTIVDVGANRGYFCVQASQRFPGVRVVAYEPDPANLMLMRENFELNGLHEIDVRPVALVPDDREEVVLYEAVHPGYHSTLSPEEFAARGHDSSRFTGQSRTLACANIGKELTSVIEESGSIDLLKIDTEGTEIDLIAALPDHVLASTRGIVAEIEEEPAEELVSRLESAGFRIDRREFTLALTR